MVNEIEYQETIEKVIPSNALANFTLELEEVYRRENGWDVGEITSTKISDTETNVKVPIVKYKENGNVDELKTTYIATIHRNNYTSELTNLYEAYREDQGWTIETPKITPINESEIIIRVPMTKREVNLTR